MKQVERTNLTKSLLAAALKNKLQTKTISKITVSELIQACNINRNTFYYHFENVYDLLKWTLEAEAVEVIKNFGLMLDYEEAIEFVLDYVESNEHILKCTYDALGRDQLSHFFFADFQEIVRIFIDGVERNLNVSVTPDFKEFLCAFYTEAISGMMLRWLCDRKNRDRKKAVSFILTTLNSSLPAIISASANLH